LARRAVELGKDDVVALSRGGYGLCFLAGEFDSGLVFVDRALQLNPDLAATWVLSGLLRNFTGEPDVAIQHLARGDAAQPARSRPLPYAGRHWVGAFPCWSL
jgi:hypothetical protein